MSALRASPRSNKKQPFLKWRCFFVAFLVVFAVSTCWRLDEQLHMHNQNGMVQAIHAFPRRQVSSSLNQEHSSPVQDTITEHTQRAAPQVWMAGIIRNASTEIQPQVLEHMVKLNCQHDISIHVVASEGVEECLEAYKDLVKQQDFDVSKCVEFVVQQEPSEFINSNSAIQKNRIDQIANVRDYQRELLRTKYDADFIHADDSVVILVDLDLYSLPPIDTLLQELHSMQAKESNFEVICAAGIMYRPFGYYDIFATVLLDGTFVYPIRGRLEQQLHEGEDYSLVRSNDVYGNFTQWDLLEYFEKESARLEGNAVPVRSCFGGLTMYRARVWFQDKCQYTANGTNKNTTLTHLQRFATETSERPCEHVVLHQCLLQANSSSVRLGVQPRLKTEWNSDTTFENKLYPSNRHDSLGVYKKHADQGDELANGDYRLRINGEGTLVVERLDENKKQGNSSAVTWSATPTVETDIDYWTHSFLMLRPRGVLELVKQVSLTELKERKHYDKICSTVNNDTSIPICECSIKSKHCKVTVWSNEGETVKLKEKSDGNRLYALVLDAKGKLEVVDETSNQTVWTNDWKKEQKDKKNKQRKEAAK